MDSNRPPNISIKLFMFKAGQQNTLLIRMIPAYINTKSDLNRFDAIKVMISPRIHHFKKIIDMKTWLKGPNR